MTACCCSHCPEWPDILGWFPQVHLELPNYTWVCFFFFTHGAELVKGTLCLWWLNPANLIAFQLANLWFNDGFSCLTMSFFSLVWIHLFQQANTESNVSVERKKERAVSSKTLKLPSERDFSTLVKIQSKSLFNKPLSTCRCGQWNRRFGMLLSLSHRLWANSTWTLKHNVLGQNSELLE